MSDGPWEVYCVGVCAGEFRGARIRFCVSKLGCKCFIIWCGQGDIVVVVSSSPSLSLVDSESEFVGVGLSVWRWGLVPCSALRVSAAVHSSQVSVVVVAVIGGGRLFLGASRMKYTGSRVGAWRGVQSR